MKQHVLVENGEILKTFVLDHYTELEAVTILGRGKNSYLAELKFSEDDATCEVLEFVRDHLFVMSSNKKSITFI